jgi:AcrR family transcriptional regulator
VTERRSAGSQIPQRDRDVRDRIRVALMDTVIEHGFASTTVEMVVERAGVERADFDRHFESFEDCHLKVDEENTVDFDEVVFSAFDGEREWRDRMRAAGYAAARYIRDNPRRVAFGVMRMYRAGDSAQVHRERQLHRLVDLVDQGRQELGDPNSISRHVAEGVIGAIFASIVKDLESGRGTGSAENFVPDLMYVAVRPYLGHEAAVEELTMPPPPERRADRGD